MQLAAGVQPPLDEKFSIAKYDRTGYLWETRSAGVDCEETWESGRNEFATLTLALAEVLPSPELYDLSPDRAAALCIDLGLIVHTEEEIDDDEEDFEEDRADSQNQD